MKDQLAADCPPVHYRRPYREMWESIEGFSWAVNSTVISVDDDKTVTYLDGVGDEIRVKADTVVYAVGTRGLYDEAIAFEVTISFALSAIVRITEISPLQCGPRTSPPTISERHM